MTPATQAVERLRDALRTLYHCALCIGEQYNYLRLRLSSGVSHPSDDEIKAACAADEPTGHIDVKLSEGLTATHKPFYHWIRESRIEVERFAKTVAEVRAAVAGLPADAMDDKNLPLVQRWSSLFRQELTEVVRWFANFFPIPLTMPKEVIVRQWVQACRRNAMPPDWPDSVQNLLRFDHHLHSIWQGYRAEEERQDELRPSSTAERVQSATPQGETERTPSESNGKSQAIKSEGESAIGRLRDAIQDVLFFCRRPDRAVFQGAASGLRRATHDAYQELPEVVSADVAKQIETALWELEHAMNSDDADKVGANLRRLMDWQERLRLELRYKTGTRPGKVVSGDQIQSPNKMTETPQGDSKVKPDKRRGRKAKWDKEKSKQLYDAWKQAKGTPSVLYELASTFDMSHNEVEAMLHAYKAFLRRKQRPNRRTN